MIKYLILIFVCLSSCKESNHKKNLFLEKKDDSVKSSTIFKLKGNYKLIIYYSKEENEEYLNYSLNRNGIDTVIVYGDPDNTKYNYRYKNIDFDDSFVLSQSGGGN